MASGGSFLDKLLLGLKAVWWNNVPVVPRGTINFIGGVVADNPGLGTTDVSLGGSSSGGGITTIESNGTILPLRTAVNFIGMAAVDNPGLNRTDVGGSFTANGVMLGNGTGQPTTVPSSVDGDVLTLVSGVPTWEPTAPGFTGGGDLQTSTSTQQWVSSISGSNGAGGAIPIHAGALRYDASQPTPGFGQDTTGAPTAQPLTDFVQVSIDPNASPGVRRIILGAQSGTGIFPRFELCYGAPETFCLIAGPYINRTDIATLCLYPPNAQLVPDGGSNWALARDSSGNLYVNAYSGGGIFLQEQGFTIPLLSVTPTLCRFIDGSGATSDLIPVGANVPTSQHPAWPRLIQYGEVLITGSNISLNYNLATTGVSLRLRVSVFARVTVAGTGTSVGDTFYDEYVAVFKNVTGTVVQEGALLDITPGLSAASLSTSTIGFTVIAGTLIETFFTVTSTSGTLGTATCWLCLDGAMI